MIGVAGGVFALVFIFQKIYQDIAKACANNKKSRFALIKIQQNHKAGKTQQVKQAVQRHIGCVGKTSVQIERKQATAENQRRSDQIFDQGKYFFQLC